MIASCQPCNGPSKLVHYHRVPDVPSMQPVVGHETAQPRLARETSRVALASRSQSCLLCVQAMLRDAETVTVGTATVSAIIEDQQLQ